MQGDPRTSSARGLECVTEKRTPASRFRRLTGATVGSIALFSDDGAENEVLFLDAGGWPCKPGPELPTPIGGLRFESYELRRVAHDNGFMNSEERSSCQAATLT